VNLFATENITPIEKGQMGNLIGHLVSPPGQTLVWEAAALYFSLHRTDLQVWAKKETDLLSLSKLRNSLWQSRLLNRPIFIF
jgi:hypothetical protein